MPSPCGRHYGFGYIENRIPSQDGSNSYRPPHIIPPCSPEFSGYNQSEHYCSDYNCLNYDRSGHGRLGQYDSGEYPNDSSSGFNTPPVKRPPSPVGDPNFPGARPPGAAKTNQNTINQQLSNDSNAEIKSETIKKTVIIGGTLLLTVFGIYLFGKNQ